MTPAPGESPKAAAERFLGPKRGILVLDNFEHLLAAAPLVSDLLAGCLRPARAGDQPRGTPAPGRASLCGDPAAGSGGRCARSGRAGGRRRAVHGACPEPRSSLRADRCQRRGGRKRVPSPRRAAARGRAGRCPHERPRPRGARRPACSSARRAWKRSAGRPRAAADAARDTRVEPPPAERGGGEGIRSISPPSRAEPPSRRRKRSPVPTSTCLRDSWRRTSCGANPAGC